MVLLPEGSAIEEMLSDYAVMREPVCGPFRTCRGLPVAPGAEPGAIGRQTE